MGFVTGEIFIMVDPDIEETEEDLNASLEQISDRVDATIQTWAPRPTPDERKSLIVFGLHLTDDVLWTRNINGRLKGAEAAF